MAPRYVSSSSIFSMVKPRNGKLAAYSVVGGVWLDYTVPPGVSKVLPIIGKSVMSLMMEGQNISQVAAFSGIDGEWHVQPLREPTTKVVPLLFDSMVIIPIGRFVYAFSSIGRSGEKGWGVLELEEGAKPVPRYGSNDWVTVEHGGKLHIFNGKNARWSSIEIKPVD
jgi:hypothetical protein